MMSLIKSSPPPQQTTTTSINNKTSNSKRRNSICTEIEETAVQQPDSTTTPEKEIISMFSPGQDVLLKQKDGCFYLGTIVKVNAENEQCLVKFGDNTDSWSNYKDLTKLSTPEQLLCVVCKKPEQEITVCDKCGRGYHQKCHIPEIPSAFCQKQDVAWMCRRCITNEPNRLRKSDSKHHKREVLPQITAAGASTKKVLPYDINSLSWDPYHRVNSEHIYCYCGLKGEWYRQMLQCGKCKQWFHERCIGCLQFPLYCGDRFYVFVCSICNHSKEFVRRLELKWVDLVHLLLFNLTAYNSKKYYDLDTVIIPYINDNWHALQLPPKIASVSKNERRVNIMSVLTSNRNRFKCGREIKKRTTIWGLRVRLPPPAPTVTLASSSGCVTEDELREMWQGNRRLQFLPSSSGTTTIKVTLDKQMRNLMMGVAYQQNTTNPSETDSPCPSPEAEEEHHHQEQDLVYVGAGCVKKSVPFSNISVQRRKRLLSESSGGGGGRDHRERLLRRPKRRNTNDGVVCASRRRSSSTSSHYHYHYKHKHHHHRRRQSDNSIIDSSSSSSIYLTRFSLVDNNKSSNSESTGLLPLTPPTSVSTPPTPPPVAQAATTVANLDSNTSGDDETSSKSTLDLIIPPPKDFEGKNNPFLTLLHKNNGHERNKKKRCSKDAITLPLPLTAVIPGKPLQQPKKRQLSEKDIFIGPNGEVKRRRLRRSNSRTFSTTQTASKTAAVVPAAAGSDKDWRRRRRRRSASESPSPSSNNCGGDYAFNGRRLRQRPEKETKQQQQQVLVVEKEKQTTVATGTTKPCPSPVKQEPDISMDDLKSSVNIYFGAATRIAAGERFTVKAKRVGPTGKLEFLIEWDGPSSAGNGMMT